MSRASEIEPNHDDDEAGSERFDQFADLPPTTSSRLLGLARQLSHTSLTSPGRSVSPSHVRQLSTCSSRRSLQDEQSRRLSTITRQRTDDLLSEIVADELQVRRKFTAVGRPRSARDPARTIDQVLYDDAAAMRARRDQLRQQAWAADVAQAGPTPDSQLLLLRKRKRQVGVAFAAQLSGAAFTQLSGAASTQGSGAAITHGSGAAFAQGSGAAFTQGSGTAFTQGSGAAFAQASFTHDSSLHRDGVRLALEQLGVLQPGKAQRPFERLWALLVNDQAFGSGPDLGVTFPTFYRFTIVILFPALLPLLMGEGANADQQHLLEEANALPGGVDAFANRPLPGAFLPGLARVLIEHANLIRLLRPTRPPHESSDDDEFDFHPEITPRSARLAGRQRHCSGPRRFTEELQEYARQAQRRRDAERARRFETELVGCTFRPATNARIERRGDGGQSRVERLYKIGVHRVEERRRRRAPARSASPPYRPFRQRAVPAAVVEERPMPRGFQETVERSRRAFRQRQRRQAERDQLGQQFVDRYDRRERRALSKAALYDSDDGRPVRQAVHDPYADWYRQQLEGRRRPPPLLYVDVKVGPGRTGRLAIFADSDADSLSADFARIFNLDGDAQARLKASLEPHCRRVQPRSPGQAESSCPGP